MKHRSVVPALSVVIAAGGVGFLAVSLYRSTTAPSPTPVPTYTNTEAAALLESAEQFLTPLTPEDRAAIPDRLAEAARPTSPSPREVALLEVFRKRMALTVDPDFDRYIDHVAELTGRTPNAVRSELGDAYRTRWENASKVFRDASYSTDGCEILPGERDKVREGGRMVFRRDPGVYGSEALLARDDAELMEVRLPIILSLSFDGEGKTLLLYLVTGFVWSDDRSTWIPHFTGLYDPTAQEDRIPGPWI
jgi:hypothetical protein